MQTNRLHPSRGSTVSRTLRRLPLMAFALLAVTAVHAVGDRSAPRVPLLPKYQQECSACHLAYPPGMLPAASWQRLMNGLPTHFGTDASLDAATVTQIGTWLQANAGQGRRAQEAPPQDRITRSAWFVREHHDIAPEVWRRAAIKSAANCAACHIRADLGVFNEHDVRIPR